MPSMLVKDGTIETIGAGLQLMNYMVAGLSTVIVVFIVVCTYKLENFEFLSNWLNSYQLYVDFVPVVFQAKPKLPPCMAQVQQQQAKKENVWKALKSMFSKRAFFLVMCSYGLNTGPYMAVSTVLNGLIYTNFPVRETIFILFHFVLLVRFLFSF